MRTKVKLLLMTAVFTLLFACTVFAAHGKVTGLKQTEADSNYIKIEWEALLSTGVKYEVSMSTDNNNWEVLDERAERNNYRKNDLTAGRTYYVRVRAVLSGEYGEYSDILAVATAPERVSDLKQISATTSSVTISWNKVEGATAYQIRQDKGSQSTILTMTTATTYTIKGLSNQEKIPFDYIYIRPVRKADTFDAVDRTTWSSLKKLFLTEFELVPSKVKNLRVDGINKWSNSTTFRYDTSMYTKGETFELYNYKNKRIKYGDRPSYGQLKNIKGQFFKLRVRPYTIIDGKRFYGEWTNYVYFAKQPTSKARKLGKRFKISWKKVKGATSYTVYMSKKSDSGYKKIATTKKLKVMISKFKKKKMKKGQEYFFKVVANKKVGKKTHKSDVNKISCTY